MDAGDRHDTRLHFQEGAARRVVLDGVGLEAGERSDQRQRVGDAVIDLVQQQFGAVAGFADRALGFLRLGLQPLLLQGGADGRAEQLAEVALHVLPDIVGGPGLERRDGDARILGAGHVDHRQVDGDALDLGQHVEARLVGQIVIERDGIEFFAGQEREPFVARTDVPDTNAVRRQRALHQPADTRIVVDVEDPDLIHRQSVAGTCITERKRPSCWMALAKLS